MSLSASKFIKDPHSSLDYVFDFSRWLDTDDTVVTATSSFSPEDESFTASSPTIVDDTAVVVWADGGIVGTDYSVTVHITTSENRIDDRTITILCRER